MSTTVDRLITRYELDDQYTKKAGAVTRSTDAMSASMAQNAAVRSKMGQSGGAAVATASMGRRQQMIDGGNAAFGAIGAAFGVSVVALIAGGAALVRAAAKHDAGIQKSIEKVQTAFDKAVTISGVAIAEKLMPMAEDFAAAVSTLADNGSVRRAFEQIADNFASVLGIDPDQDTSGVMMKAAEKMLEAAVMISEAAALGKVLTAFSPFDIITDLFDKNPWSSRNQAQPKNKVKSRAERFSDELSANAQLGAKTGALSGSTPELRVLDKIERHTREMVNFQRMVLGGGELGRQGVTAVDVGGMRGGRGRGGGGRVEVAVRNLVDAITSSTWESMDQSSRGAQRA